MFLPRALIEHLLCARPGEDSWEEDPPPPGCHREKGLRGTGEEGGPVSWLEMEDLDQVRVWELRERLGEPVGALLTSRLPIP